MDWAIIQVVVGLSFLFFLLSIIASAVNEAIAGIFGLRARTLEKGIANMFTGSTRDPKGNGILRELYSHPLIRAEGRAGKKPSYLPSRTFGSALLDIVGLLDLTSVHVPAGDRARAEEIRASVERQIDQIPDATLKRSLMSIWRSVGRNSAELLSGVERWFDGSMERVSGWYKRRTGVILFLVGLAVAVILNASAITAADRLWKDEGLRKGLIAAVEGQREELSGAEALDRLEELRFPIGWEEANQPQTASGWVLAVVGWLVTGIAVTFGAPFWFDLLNRVSNLRATGGKPGPSPTG